jgi:hypothetical protein
MSRISFDETRYPRIGRITTAHKKPSATSVTEGWTILALPRVASSYLVAIAAIATIAVLAPAVFAGAVLARAVRATAVFALAVVATAAVLGRGVGREAVEAKNRGTSHHNRGQQF